MKAEVINLENKKVGDIDLKDDIFKREVRSDILQRAVEWQRAKARAGTHKAKEVGEIRGTTKKPFRQKGTGNARQGSNRSPQMRGGAVIFGPKVRSHEHKLTKKFRKLALKTALSAKAADNKIRIIKDLKFKTSKTIELTKALKNLDLNKSLFIDADAIDESFAKAIRNIKHNDALPVAGANVYDIIKHDNLVLTEAAVARLEERL